MYEWRSCVFREVEEKAREMLKQYLIISSLCVCVGGWGDGGKGRRIQRRMAAHLEGMHIKHTHFPIAVLEQLLNYIQTTKHSLTSAPCMLPRDCVSLRQASLCTQRASGPLGGPVGEGGGGQHAHIHMYQSK